MIPKQLRHLSFCRIRFKTKKPFEMDWWNKPYTYEKISKFQGENYGVLCGHHNLAVIDCDVSALSLAVESLLPKTFSVRTGSGGMHFYYFIPDLKQKIILETEVGEHLGEIQSHGQQVVGAGSVHPSGKTYEIMNDSNIAEISLPELEMVLGNFMKKERKRQISKGSGITAKIIEKVSIIDIARKHGIDVDKKGFALCIFHEDSDPSLKFYDSQGRFYCFGCRRFGNLIDFIWLLRQNKIGEIEHG